MKFKQEQPYGCGVYAVAHAMRDDFFVTDKRIEESKKGNNMWQLNNWLVQDGKDYILEPIYFNILAETTQKLPPKEYQFNPIEEDFYFPFVMDVKSNLEGKWHLVAGYSDKQGNVVIIDSMKDEEIKTNWEELIEGKFYPIIYSIHGFAPIKQTGEWKMLTK
jgi:hypothetical protein